MDEQSEDKARAYIFELFQIVSTSSILVVTYEGEVIRLNCPFRVVCNVNIPPLEKGSGYFVQAIRMTLALQEVFIIKGKAYYVWFFSIRI